MTTIETIEFLALLHQGPMPRCKMNSLTLFYRDSLNQTKSPPSHRQQHRAGPTAGTVRTVMSNIFGEHKMFLYSKYFWLALNIYSDLPTRMSFRLFCSGSLHSFEKKKSRPGSLLLDCMSPRPGLALLYN